MLVAEICNSLFNVMEIIVRDRCAHKWSSLWKKEAETKLNNHFYKLLKSMMHEQDKSVISTNKQRETELKKRQWKFMFHIKESS